MGKITAAFATLVLLSVSSQAFAECVCTTSLTNTSGSIGSILSSSGSVLYSGESGFVNATNGAALTSGSQVSTGDGASAQISVGPSCSVSLPENPLKLIVPV